MDHKIIFTDIDGTLLNKDRELSKLTIQVICQLQKKVPVVLISSRMPQAMRHLQEQLQISHQPLICYNGGLVLMNNKIVSSTEIPLFIISELMEFNKKHNCHISLYNNEEWVVPTMDFWAKREESNTKVTPKISTSEKVLAKWKKENKGAHKIMCMGDENTIDELLGFLTENFNDALHVYRSKSTYLEIANKKVSKLTAINLLLENHFHLNLEDAIAFGDNYNDFEMLKAVGMGIAVENAKPEILEIAKETTFHCADDGVAKSLQKLFELH